MKKVIITGANGFIGSNLTKIFSEDGFEVTAVVRDKNSDVSSISSLQGIKIVYCSLDNIEDLSSILTEKYDLFLHFAWDSSAGIGRCDENLQLKNIEATCKAVKTAKKLGCKRFVFAGSIMAYEARESVLNNGFSPSSSYIYSISKLTASMMAKTVAVSENIEFVDVVISNIYGVGEKSMRFLNSTVHKIISGEHLKLTSCQQTYDFIYVTDAAEAIKTVALKGKNLTSYYIGNREQRKLKEFVLDIKQALESDVDIEFGAIPFNGVYFDYKDIIDTEGIYKLGFNTKVDFKFGVKKLAESIRKD